MKHLEDFFHYFSFFKFFRVTAKYKQCYQSTAGLISIILSVITTIILSLYYLHNSIVFYQKIDSFIVSFTPGLFGLLGVYIAGVSFMTAMISKKALDVVDEEEKIGLLAKMLFSYYFAGACLLLTIINLTFLYFRDAILVCYKMCREYINIDYVSASSNFLIVVVIIFISSYLFFFSISYTTSLLGLCINFFFANSYMEKKANKVGDNNNHDKVYLVLLKER